MEIKHQSPSELEMPAGYRNDARQIHPAYRQENHIYVDEPRQNCNPPYCHQVLPGYHVSPAFRSGSFSEPQMDQNLQNNQFRRSFNGHGRPRSVPIGTQKRPNADQLMNNRNNVAVPYHNVENHYQRFSYHFEGFQEGYNPNFVECANPESYSLQQSSQYHDFNKEVNGSARVEENLRNPNMIQYKGTEVGRLNHVEQISSSILDCNIADVIKRELEIDGTLDFI